jgi:hypothetical protein
MGALPVIRSNSFPEMDVRALAIWACVSEFLDSYIMMARGNDGIYSIFLGDVS